MEHVSMLRRAIPAYSYCDVHIFGSCLFAELSSKEEGATVHPWWLAAHKTLSRPQLRAAGDSISPLPFRCDIVVIMSTKVFGLR